MVGEFSGLRIGTGHYEVDWPAALGGDLLHIGEGVQLVSRRTQPMDFRAYVEDADFPWGKAGFKAVKSSIPLDKPCPDNVD